MSIEGAIRKRARRASQIGAVSLFITLLILGFAFAWTPRIVHTSTEFFPETLTKGENNAERKNSTTVIVVLTISSLTVFFGCYLLGRHSFRQFELGTRLVAIAD